MFGFREERSKVRCNIKIVYHSEQVNEKIKDLIIQMLIKSINIFCAILLIGSTIEASVVIVPPQKSATEVWVRIGETKQISNPPDFPFENVYSKTVYSLDQNNNQRDFSNVCYESPADIIFTQTFSYAINVTKQDQNIDIVTSFEEIKADRRILDTTLLNDQAYLLLRQNKMLVFNIKSNSNKPVSLTVPTQTPNKTIQTGFFVKIEPSKLLLITPQQAFIIQGQKIIKIKGYEAFADLQSVRQLYENYFAICGISSGIILYGFENNTLNKKAVLNTTFFQRDAIFISDMAYNPDDNELFVSDQKFGINIVKLEKRQDLLKTTLSNLGYRKFGCSVVVYSGGNLYSACDDLFKIKYSTSEQIVAIPHPMFKIKDLLVYKGLLVAVGEDLIAKYYNDKQTQESPEFDVSEKLMFYDNNKYLMVNYYQISSGTFSIKYPSIECSTTNQSMESIVNAVLKTEAECSQGYLSKYSLVLQQPIQKQNVCLYSSPIQFHFWKAEHFNIDIIFVAMGVLFLVAGIITTWAIFIYSKEMYLRRTLDNYSNPNAVQLQPRNAAEGYQNMIEENQHQNTSENKETNISNTMKSLEQENKHYSID